MYDYKDIFRHCTDEEITTVTEIPYFEGDFWPNVVEETIKELDMEEEEERKASEAASVDVHVRMLCTLTNTLVQLLYTNCMLASPPCSRTELVPRKLASAALARKAVARKLEPVEPRTAKRVVLSSEETLSPRRFIRPWRSTKRCVWCVCMCVSLCVSLCVCVCVCVLWKLSPILFLSGVFCGAVAAALPVLSSSCHN